jgi:hypothetical protein
MKDPRNHLPRDLKALRYLDALNAGDLEVVSALWEEAFHDPELEQILAEVDGAMFQEILGKPSSLPERLGRRRRRWAVWGGAVVALAAACLLAMLVWPLRDSKKQVPSSPMSRTADPVALRPLDVSHGVTPLLEARRDLDSAEMPTFVWPLENLLSASTPLDRLE